MTGAPVVHDRMSDEELVATFVRGSKEAYTLLVGRYKNPLVNYVTRVLGDRDTALDIVQDTFVRLHDKAHTYRPVAKFSTWIYTIASNLARSELRRRKWGIQGRRSREAPGTGIEHHPDPGPRPDRIAQAAITADHVARALAALPESFRQAAVLFYLEDMPYEEICRVLGVRMGTLKSRLNRARAMLEASLRPFLGGDDGD